MSQIAIHAHRDGGTYKPPLAGEEFPSKSFNNNILYAIIHAFMWLHAVLERCVKSILAHFQHVTGQIHLASTPFVVFDNQDRVRPPTGRSIFATRSFLGNIQFTIAFLSGLTRKLFNMPPRTSNRTTISLTDSEIDALKNLRDHFDTQSVSETIRRSISQSSLLKRYSDEEGDLTVERDGKKFVIPARR